MHRTQGAVRVAAQHARTRRPPRRSRAGTHGGPRSHPRGRSAPSRRAAAVWLDRPMRSSKVCSPRQTRYAACGSRQVPSVMTRRCTSRTRSTSPTTAPAMTSECPLRNFVAEWTTTSAPSVSGCTAVRRGERVVDDEPRAGVVRDRRERRQVGELQLRIGQRLDVDHRRRAGGDRLAPGVEVERRRPAPRRSPRPAGREPAGPGYRRRPAGPPRCGRPPTAGSAEWWRSRPCPTTS